MNTVFIKMSFNKENDYNYNSYLKMNLKKFIKGFDQFGHVITLNFNRNGNSHKTSIGGFFSIFIQIFVTFYVASCFWVMFMKLGDKRMSR